MVYPAEITFIAFARIRVLNPHVPNQDPGPHVLGSRNLLWMEKITENGNERIIFYSPFK